ncbi:MAG TPA: hypothetical protein VK550_16360, partial [Polyangiaceae bacterium]|nr:hypothetical protein [Polyangiaceae bacterium]
MSVYRQWAAWIGCIVGVGALALGCGGQPDLAIGAPKEAGPPPVPGIDASAPPTTMPPIVLSDGAVVDMSVRPDVNCDRVACTTDAARYCGTIGDNCGGTLNCGDCPAGQICRDSICGPAFDDACVPLACKQPGGSYCGRIGDGCGQLLDCGSCTAPLTCAGGGLANICGTNPDSGDCNATTCTPINGRYCGVVGNGCGGLVDCG